MKRLLIIFVFISILAETKAQLSTYQATTFNSPIDSGFLPVSVRLSGLPRLRKLNLRTFADSVILYTYGGGAFLPTSFNKDYTVDVNDFQLIFNQTEATEPILISSTGIGNPATSNNTLYFGYDASSLGTMQTWDDFVYGAAQVNGGGGGNLNNFTYFRGFNITSSGGRLSNLRPQMMEQYEQQFEITGFGASAEYWHHHATISGNTIRFIHFARSNTFRKSLLNLQASTFNWFDDSLNVEMATLGPSGLQLMSPSAASYDNVLTFNTPSGTGPSFTMVRKRNNANNNYFTVLGSDASNNIIAGDGTISRFEVQATKLMIPAKGMTITGYPTFFTLHFIGDVNTFLGLRAGEDATLNNDNNVGVGFLTLGDLTGSAAGNTGVGAWAGFGINGNGNTVLGRHAMGRVGVFGDADKNVVIGDSAAYNMTGLTDYNLIINNNAGTQPLVYGKFSQTGVGKFGINVTAEPRTTLDVDGNVAYKLSTATDANFTVPATKVVVLVAITAGRNCVMPAGVAGQEMIVHNRNTSGNNWTFTGTTVKDAAGSTITTLTNSTIYYLYSDGTDWYAK